MSADVFLNDSGSPDDSKAQASLPANPAECAEAGSPAGWEDWAADRTRPLPSTIIRGVANPSGVEPAKGAAQNPAQQPSESPRNNPQRQPHTLEFAEKCEGVQCHAYTKADGRGFEPPVDFRPQRFSRPPP